MATREIATADSNSGEVNYLQTELSSLGVTCKRMNNFNDRAELEALITAIKEVYFQDCKAAYNTNHIEIY